LYVRSFSADFQQPPGQDVSFSMQLVGTFAAQAGGRQAGRLLSSLNLKSSTPPPPLRVSLQQGGRSGLIRSMAHDFGRALGTCSHLLALRREAVGPFSVQDAWTLDVLLPLLKRYRDSSSKRRSRR
jgi:hypothetical protein